MDMNMAKEAVAQAFDGECVIYALERGQDGALIYAESWRRVAEAPCHLQILRAEAAKGTDGVRPAARCRLFLPPELGPELAPGCRVEVLQHGRTYRLGDGGLAVCWPTHCQIELVLVE